MSFKKLSAVTLSALMATTAMLPMTAMADQQPSVEYTGGTGDPITHLMLIANDANLANNYTEEWNKTNAKVEVPVAINYVAQSSGNIVGPSDNQAQIRNFAGFPVNVTNIQVTAGANVTLVSTAAAADSADEIYLQMKPGTSGEIISLADFTSSATESSTGADDGTGKRPDSGEDWNIAAAVSGVGTSSAQASVLNLNSLGGKIGGFNNLDPAQRQEIGQITWTIKPGTYANPVPRLTADLTELHDIGTQLRSGQADADYIANLKTMVGQTINITLADDTVMPFRLVSVDTRRGLTFEAASCLPTTAQMNTTNTISGGWSSANLKTSLNSGTLYNTYFAGTELASKAITVSNSSFKRVGETYSTTTSSEKFWIPSMNNIFGPGWSFGGNTDGSSDTRFDYYAAMTEPAIDEYTDDDRLKKQLEGVDYTYWLRSTSNTENTAFSVISANGRYSTSLRSDSQYGVVPCFCL